MPPIIDTRIERYEGEKEYRKGLQQMLRDGWELITVDSRFSDTYMVAYRRVRS